MESFDVPDGSMPPIPVAAGSGEPARLAAVRRYLIPDAVPEDAAPDGALERSLLPPALPKLPFCEIAAH
ncbi:hypothetical protein [Actinoallomurus sp. CA-150999]|uniref:hypothetical protein n=1 Tax=Actinoallomurus sp. CA-150999 TaxID=3239887 RepID=UPI003D92FADB